MIEWIKANTNNLISMGIVGILMVAFGLLVKGNMQ